MVEYSVLLTLGFFWVLGYVAGRGVGKAKALEQMLGITAAVQSRHPGNNVDMASLKAMVEQGVRP